VGERRLLGSLRREKACKDCLTVEDCRRKGLLRRRTTKAIGKKKSRRQGTNYFVSAKTVDSGKE